MTYLIFLALIIALSLVLKIGSRYLFILAGLLIILHPLLLAKGQISAAYQLSIVAFLLFLSALIIDVIIKIFPHRFDRQDSFIINVFKNNINIRITGVTVGTHYIKKNYLFFTLVMFFIIIFWKIGFTATVFAILLVAFVANRWSSRIIIVCALVSISASSLLLIYKQEPIAEDFAIYAYYFLVLIVALFIIENIREQRLHGE